MATCDTILKSARVHIKNKLEKVIKKTILYYETYYETYLLRVFLASLEVSEKKIELPSHLYRS